MEDITGNPFQKITSEVRAKLQSQPPKPAKFTSPVDQVTKATGLGSPKRIVYPSRPAPRGVPPRTQEKTAQINQSTWQMRREVLEFNRQKRHAGYLTATLTQGLKEMLEKSKVRATSQEKEKTEQRSEKRSVIGQSRVKHQVVHLSDDRKIKNFHFNRLQYAFNESQKNERVLGTEEYRALLVDYGNALKEKIIRVKGGEEYTGGEENLKIDIRQFLTAMNTEKERARMDKRSVQAASPVEQPQQKEWEAKTNPIIKEIYTTEKTFFENKKRISDLLPEIKKIDSSVGAILSDFYNRSNESSKQFFEALGKEGEQSLENTLAAYTNHFDAYTETQKGNLGIRTKEWTLFLNTLQSKKSQLTSEIYDKILTLQPYIVVVQRFPRHKLLVEDLVKKIPNDNPYHEKFTEILDKIKTKTNEINQEQKESDKILFLDQLDLSESLRYNELTKKFTELKNLFGKEIRDEVGNIAKEKEIRLDRLHHEKAKKLVKQYFKLALDELAKIANQGEIHDPLGFSTTYKNCATLFANNKDSLSTEGKNIEKRLQKAQALMIAERMENILKMDAIPEKEKAELDALFVEGEKLVDLETQKAKKTKERIRTVILEKKILSGNSSGLDNLTKDHVFSEAEIKLYIKKQIEEFEKQLRSSKIDSFPTFRTKLDLCNKLLRENPALFSPRAKKTMQAAASLCKNTRFENIVERLENPTMETLKATFDRQFIQDYFSQKKDEIQEQVKKKRIGDIEIFRKALRTCKKLSDAGVVEGGDNALWVEAEQLASKKRTQTV